MMKNSSDLKTLATFGNDDQRTYWDLHQIDIAADKFTENFQVDTMYFEHFSGCFSMDIGHS